METKAKMVEKLKPLVPTTTASIKHSPTSGQTNINSYTEGPFTSPFLLPRISCPAFNSRKIARHSTRQAKLL